MNVSGIRPYEGFYDYNSIKLSQIRNQQVEALQKQDVNPDVDVQLEDKPVQVVPEQKFSSYDYAQQYRPDEEFDLKGIDSDINSLDAERVVSDLEKDQILQQYQYFVGDDAFMTVRMKQPEDMILRSGENFFL